MSSSLLPVHPKKKAAAKKSITKAVSSAKAVSASAPTVLVLYGGPSGEHAVSVLSAKNVIAALKEAGFRVSSFCVSQEGEWGPAIDRINALRKNVCVFPLIHGTYGEDGSLQGLLELLNVAYVGSGVLGSALGMDKALQKQLLKDAGIPVLPFFAFDAALWRKDQAKVLKDVRRVCGAKFPLFVKPARLGSSVGVRKVTKPEELPAAVRAAFRFDTKVIVEQGLEKPREIECSVFGSPAIVTRCGEITYDAAFYDYDAKYHDERTKLHIPSTVNATITKQVQAMALKAFEVLDLAHYARADFFLSADGKVYSNEVNTIPGFTAMSMFPKLLELQGFTLVQVMKSMVRMAEERQKAKQALVREYSHPV